MWTCDTCGEQIDDQFDTSGVVRATVATTAIKCSHLTRSWHRSLEPCQASQEDLLSAALRRIVAPRVKRSWNVRFA